MRAHLLIAGLTIALCAPLSARAADPPRAPSTAYAPRPMGHVKIEDPSFASLTILVDRVEAGRGPVVDVPPGEHEIMLEDEDQGPLWRVTVTVAAGETVAPRFEPTPPYLRKNPLGSIRIGGARPILPDDAPWTVREYTTLAMVSVGVLAAGGAIVFGTLSGATGSRSQNLLDQPPSPSWCADPVPDANAAQCAAVHESQVERKRYATVAAGLLVASSALVIGGAMMYLLWTPSAKKPPPKAAVVPVFDPTTRSGAVVGRIVF